jgi:hypothetical protein
LRTTPGFFSVRRCQQNLIRPSDFHNEGLLVDGARVRFRRACEALARCGIGDPRCGRGPPFGEFSGEPVSCRTRESGTPTDLGEAQYRMLLRERAENAHHPRCDCSGGTVSASARHDGPPPSLRDSTRARTPATPCPAPCYRPASGFGWGTSCRTRWRPRPGRPQPRPREASPARPVCRCPMPDDQRGRREGTR